jgi:hypothetical protein
VIHRGFVAVTRCVETRGPLGNRSPGLLDANETIWAFVTPSCVGCARKPRITALGGMVTGIRRSSVAYPLRVDCGPPINKTNERQVSERPRDRIGVDLAEFRSGGKLSSAPSMDYREGQRQVSLTGSVLAAALALVFPSYYIGVRWRRRGRLRGLSFSPCPTQLDPCRDGRRYQS